MKVVPMLNELGNVVKNQYTYFFEGNHYLQSYDKYVVKIAENGQIFLDENYWEASKTTEKYRNMFLDMDTSEIYDNIQSGEIILENLNED